MKLIEREYDIKELDYTNSLEISLEARILIKYILKFLFEVKNKKESLLKAINEDKYNELKDIQKVMSYLQYNPILKEMQKDLWNTLSPTALLKIAKNEPFKTKSTWSEDLLLITIDTLPKYSSFDTFSKSDDKAEAARLLGAKII